MAVSNAVVLVESINLFFQRTNKAVPADTRDRLLDATPCPGSNDNPRAPARVIACEDCRRHGPAFESRRRAD